jgi:hypothetical protein
MITVRDYGLRAAWLCWSSEMTIDRFSALLQQKLLQAKPL